MRDMKIKICKALVADISSPYVWMSASLMSEQDHLRYFRISVPAADGKRRSIVCQVYRATKDYERRFKKSRPHVPIDGCDFIVMSEHYRNILNGLKVDDFNEVEIERMSWEPWAVWKASKYNPNRSERLALQIAVVSLAVSILFSVVGLVGSYLVRGKTTVNEVPCPTTELHTTVP